MLNKLKAVIVGTVALCLKTVAVITFLAAITVFALLAPQYLPVPNAWAEYSSGAIKGLSTLTGIAENILSTNGALHAFGQLLSYEDTLNSAARVETQTSYSGSKVADYQVKNAPGFVHALNCMGDGSALAGGTVILYDSLTEAGAIIWQGDFIITGDYRAFTVPLNNVATIGLYLGFTTVSVIHLAVRG